MRRAPDYRVKEYEGLAPTFGELLGKAFLNARPFVHIIAFVASVAALRAWGPVELQVKIDSWTDAPLRSTRAAISTGVTRAVGLARAVEHGLGWQSDSADPKAEANSF